jgi:putative tricarboxylic transport membrane protein
MKVGEGLFSAGIALAGLAIAAQTLGLPEAPGYSQVSPRLFPAIVAAGLLITGLVLLVQVIRGGFVNLPNEQRNALDVAAVAWISGGVLAHMALIGVVGFIGASTLLFAAVARGYGSRRLFRDVGIGLLLAIALYLIFTQALGLSLGPVFSTGGAAKA